MLSNGGEGRGYTRKIQQTALGLLPVITLGQEMTQTHADAVQLPGTHTTTDDIQLMLCSHINWTYFMLLYSGWIKNKPLPNYQKMC